MSSADLSDVELHPTRKCTTMALIMDFENAAAIQDVFASDAYQALIPDRDRAFSSVEILITEELS